MHGSLRGCFMFSSGSREVPESQTTDSFVGRSSVSYGQLGRKQIQDVGSTQETYRQLAAILSHAKSARCARPPFSKS